MTVGTHTPLRRFRLGAMLVMMPFARMAGIV